MNLSTWWGRAPTCALRINQRYVSARHAILRWTGEQWELKDLGSRNGTFLGGRKIAAGADHAISKGTVLAFGKLEQQWELVDDSPPSVMAVPMEGGEPVLSDGDLLALPSSETPLVTVYPNPEGGWLLEQPNEAISPITNLQTFEIAGQIWKFCCPERINETSLADYSPELEVRHLELTFSVSRDEEHVQLNANCGARVFDLGSRTHNFMLLTLARQRLADTAQGLPDTSCGWVYQDDLSLYPNATFSELNIDVYRIRKQFAALGVVDAASIIERRPRTRQIRIGTGRISVITL